MKNDVFSDMFLRKSVLTRAIRRNISGDGILHLFKLHLKLYFVNTYPKLSSLPQPMEISSVLLGFLGAGVLADMRMITDCVLRCQVRKF
jgi:hypothetical protein